MNAELHQQLFTIASESPGGPTEIPETVDWKFPL